MKPVATRAFLASTTRMTQEQSSLQSSGLRREAWMAAGEKPEVLFVAEHAYEKLKPPKFSHLDIATYLLEQVRLSSAFICLLNGESSGASMTPRETELSTTFFELELFQAIVLNHPIYLLIHESFDPVEIGPYLDLLEFGLPNWRVQLQSKMSDVNILRAIHQILQGNGEAWKLQRHSNLSQNLHTGLFYARDRFANDSSSPKIHFLQLDRQLESSRLVSPNLVAISDLMRNRRSFEEEVNNDRRLAFSWLLARELMVAPLLNRQGEVIQQDPYVLSAWNATLEDWHGAASWLGLHGNIHFGTIPTLDTLDVVRQALRKTRPEDIFGGQIDFPGGAYASSYYSLAKRVQPREKKFVLDIAEKLLRRGHSGKDLLSKPGNLLLLGSIALERGFPTEAIEYFVAAVDLHRLDGTKPRAMGIALCELAFARLFVGQVKRAMDESMEGIHLLQTSSIDGELIRDGFLVRAMIKAAAIQMRGRHFMRGLKLYREALNYAKVNHLDDSYGQWKPSGLALHFVNGMRRRFGDRFHK